MPRPYYSTVVSAPIDEVWSIIRDFGAISDWHPSLKGSRLTRGSSGGEISAQRRFVVPDAGDAHVLEELVALDDQSWTQTFSMLDGWPLRGGAATLRLAPIGRADQTFVEWWADLDVNPGVDADALKESVIEVIFAPGLDALTKRFGRRGGGGSRPRSGASPYCALEQ